MPGQEHPAARGRVADSVVPDGPQSAARERGSGRSERPAVPLAGVQDEPPGRARADRHARRGRLHPGSLADLGARPHQPVHPGRPALRHAVPAAARHAGGQDVRLRRAVLLPAGAEPAELPPHRVRHHHGPALPVHADRLPRAHLADLGRAALPGPGHAGRDQHRRHRGAGLPGRHVRRPGRAARAGRAADPRILRAPHQPVPGHRGAARRRLPAGRPARDPEPPAGAGRRAARLRGADQGDGHGGRGRHRHHAGDRHAPRPDHGAQARPRGPEPGWYRRWPSRPGRSW